MVKQQSKYASDNGIIVRFHDSQERSEYLGRHPGSYPVYCVIARRTMIDYLTCHDPIRFSAADADTLYKSYRQTLRENRK